MIIKNLWTVLRKVDFFSNIKIDYPSNEEIERTKEITKLFNIKNGGKLTRLYLKSDVFLLTCVFEKFSSVSIKEFDINLMSVTLFGYTWPCRLKYTDIKLQTLQDKDMILFIEIFIRGGKSSAMGDRYVKRNVSKKILYTDAIDL